MQLSQLCGPPPHSLHPPPTPHHNQAVHHHTRLCAKYCVKLAKINLFSLIGISLQFGKFLAYYRVSQGRVSNYSAVQESGKYCYIDNTPVINSKTQLTVVQAGLIFPGRYFTNINGKNGNILILLQTETETSKVLVVRAKAKMQNIVSSV